MMTHLVDSSSLASRREKLIYSAALFLLPLIYFFPAVTGKVAIAPGDVWTSNLGVRVLLGLMLQQGELPLWNPYIFGGMPLLANVYTGALYPPNWVFAIFSPAVALNLLMITTAQMALSGTYLFARRIGMARSGALVAGIIFTFSGFLIAHLEHLHRLTAVVWLPWILLSIEQLYLRASWRWITFGAVFIAVQLFAGEPQITLYTAMTGAAYALFSLFARAECERRWRFVVSGLLMSVVGLLISLTQLLPSAELLSQGERAQLSYQYFAGYSLPPGHIVTLIFPYFFGGASLAPYSLPYRGEWNASIPSGYVGLLGLMLILAGWFGLLLTRADKLAAWRTTRRMIGFWTGVAVVSLVLAFGAYLPFGLNYLLYRVPVYNLFRGSYRHWFEFTFAAAMLAGFGVTRLRAVKHHTASEIIRGSVAVIFLLVAAVAALFRFSARTAALANPEAFIPIIVFLFSATTLWFYGFRRGAVSELTLITMLLVDLASFGWFFSWRAVPDRVNERLLDTATVKYIKERESDLSSFRVVSQSALPYDSGYDPKKNPELHDLLNVSNSLIPRGLQSVCGYDLFRPLRVSKILGQQDAQGIILDAQAFNSQPQGMNLLNVRYLLLARPRALRPDEGLNVAGLRFAITPLHLMLGPGGKFTTETGAQASELAIVSLLADSGQIPDQSVVARIRLHTTDNRVIEREILAGRDTAEWAWDRANVSETIRHRRAAVAESTQVESPDGNYQAHTYLARFSFDRALVERVEFEYVRPDAQMQLVRASLIDHQTGSVTPLDDVPLPAERWKKLKNFAEVHLYENLKALPRAWFVSRLVIEPEQEILRAINEGKLRDGQPFDPQQVALLEAESVHQSLPAVGSVGAEVKVTRYEPNRIELMTRNPQTGFLALSEVYFAGWQARVDGVVTEIHRTDYTLRGVVVPAGVRRVEFIYRPASLINGAMFALAGIALLLGGAVSTGYRLRRATE
jgi:hypothetical protein